jgi:CheY-like chemotaxis protein
VNARDAMPQGGRLSIETANVALDETVGESHFDVRPGSYVMLAVSDTGIGMDAATKAQVFEPFFTTKERGKGTGLGLSTVFGIVKQSGGSIYLYSEPGVGTTFKIYFPFAEGPLGRTEQASAETRGGQGCETILLVEDEEQVREVAAAILRAAGFHVLAAAAPADAILVCEESPERIDLLLTDVIMPRMNGRQLAERIRLLRPEVRVLYMSGYTDDMILSNGTLAAGASFIQKPMMPDSLTRKVRDVLDRPADSPIG